MNLSEVEPELSYENSSCDLTLTTLIITGTGMGVRFEEKKPDKSLTTALLFELSVLDSESNTYALNLIEVMLKNLKRANNIHFFVWCDCD